MYVIHVSLTYNIHERSLKTMMHIKLNTKYNHVMYFICIFNNY